MHAYYARHPHRQRRNDETAEVPDAYFGIADGDEDAISSVARASRVERLLELVNDVLGLPANTLSVDAGTDVTTGLRFVLLQVQLAESTRLDASLRVEGEWSPMADFSFAGAAGLSASVEALLQLGVLLGRPQEDAVHVALRLGEESGPDGNCGGTNETYVVCADIMLQLRYGLDQDKVAVLTMRAGQPGLESGAAALVAASIDGVVAAAAVASDPALVLFTSTSAQLLRLTLIAPVPGTVSIDTADGDASFITPYFNAASLTASVSGTVEATASAAIGNFVGVDVNEISGQVSASASLAFRTPDAGLFASSAAQTAVTVSELLGALASRDTVLDVIAGGVELAGALALNDVQIAPISLGLPFEVGAELGPVGLTLDEISSGDLPSGVNYTLTGPLDKFSLSNVSPELIAQALQALAQYLQDTLSGDTLKTEVPYTGISLDDLLAGFITLIDELLAAAADPAGRLAAVELSLEAALGLAATPADVTRGCTGSCLLEFALSTAGTADCPSAVTLRLNLEYTANSTTTATFNLQLASLLSENINNAVVAAAIERLVDLDASANLLAGVSATASLQVGITLDPENPTRVEVFLGAASGIQLRALVSASELNVRAALGPISASLVNGMAAVDIAAIALLGNEDDVLGGRGYYLLPTSGAPVCAAAEPIAALALPYIEGGLEASLPLELAAGGDPITAQIAFSGSFRLDGSTSLSIPSASITQLQDAVLQLIKDNPVNGLLEDGQLFRAGLGLAFDALQELLVDALSGVSLPLVGDGLGRAIEGILTTLRSSIIDALVSAMTDTGSPDYSIVDSMRQAFVDVLNSNGLLPEGASVDVFFVDQDLVRVDVGEDGVGADGIAFGLIFGDERTETLPLNFDLGVPDFELELQSTAQVELSFTWQLQLQAVYSKSRGFGLLALSPEGPEFTMTASAIIVPEAGAENLATGRIFVVNVAADMLEDEGMPTGITVNTGLALSGDQPDGSGLVTLGRLLSGRALTLSLSAGADVNLALTAGVGSGEDNFVSFDVTLSAGLGFEYDTASGALTLLPPSLQFLDVQLELRTLFQNLADQLLSRTGSVIEPLQDVISQLEMEVRAFEDATG